MVVVPAKVYVRFMVIVSEEAASPPSIEAPTSFCNPGATNDLLYSGSVVRGGKEALGFNGALFRRCHKSSTLTVAAAEAPSGLFFDSLASQHFQQRSELLMKRLVGDGNCRPF